MANANPKARNLVILFAAVLPLAGCQAEINQPFDLVWIWREIPWFTLFWQIARWTFLGGLVGLGLGLGLFFLLRRFKLYDYPGTMGPWIRRIICTWMIISLTVLTGAAAWFEGLVSTSEVGLRESPIGKKWLPQAGAYGADLFFLVDQSLHQKEMPAEKLDVKVFVGQLDLLKEAMAEKLARQMIDKALEQNPDWKGTNSEALIRWALPWLAQKLLDRKVRESLEKWGARGLMEELQNQAMGLEGQAMNRAQLGQFLSDQVIVPAILYPLRYWIRSTQKVIALMALAAVLLPVGMVQLARWFFLKKG